MELDCGIARRRIDEWLVSELELAYDGACWVFESEDASCRITTADLASRPLGPIAVLERTCLRVEGDDAAVESFMHLFTLRFISAGG